MNKKVKAETLLAYSTIALAVFTAAMAFETYELASESREASFRQIGVQTWLEFEKRFDSMEMLRARKNLAKQFQSYDQSKDVVISEKVMDFFEDLGTAYRLGYIDKKLADSSFGFYACRWYEASKAYIDSEQKRHGEDESFYADFKGVAKGMRLKDEKIDAKELKMFLEDESELVAE